jgi:tyrosine-specific transport protein
MDLKLLGSILLVIGTAIGAGLLALPVATAHAGFVYTSLLMIVIWFFMTCSALLILEVNLRMPLNSNLISMTKSTLGRPAAAIMWCAYLLLLYSVISAYSAGGADIVHSLLQMIHVNAPTWIDVLLFIGCLIFIVYRGIRSVDWANRGLMIVKLGAFFCLILLALPHTRFTDWPAGNTHGMSTAIMVIVTSFAFAIIVPSLRVYLKSDRRRIYIAIMSGSIVALICYLLWIFVIQTIIPQQQLIAVSQSGHPVGGLISALIAHLQTPIITTLVHLFAAICMMTSFLGVALSLTDFIADGLNLRTTKQDKCIVFLTAFLPPMIIVLFFPGIFIKALSYAGIFCVIILILFPALMAWKIRKRKTEGDAYQLRGGQPLLAIIILFATVLLIMGVIQTF